MLRVIPLCCLILCCLTRSVEVQSCSVSQSVVRNYTVSYLNGSLVSVELCWITPRNTPGGTLFTSYRISLVCPDETYQKEITSRTDVTFPGVPCAKRCIVNIYLITSPSGSIASEVFAGYQWTIYTHRLANYWSGDRLTCRIGCYAPVQSTFYPASDLSSNFWENRCRRIMPLSPVAKISIEDEKAFLLVQSSDTVPMVCGAPTSVQVVLKDSTNVTSDTVFTNWTNNSRGDVLFTDVVDICQLPRTSIVYYNTSVDRAQPESAKPTLLLPGKYQNLFIQGVIMYPSTLHVLVNYSSFGICGDVVWQLHYNHSDGHDVVKNFSSDYERSYLSLSADDLQTLSSVRGRAMHVLGGEWSDPFRFSYAPVLSYTGKNGSCLYVDVNAPTALGAELLNVRIQVNYTRNGDSEVLDLPNGSHCIPYPSCYGGVVLLTAVTTFGGDPVEPAESIPVQIEACPTPYDLPLMEVLLPVMFLAFIGLIVVIIGAAILTPIWRHRSAENLKMRETLRIEAEYDPYNIYVGDRKDSQYNDVDNETSYDDPLQDGAIMDTAFEDDRYVKPWIGASFDEAATESSDKETEYMAPVGQDVVVAKGYTVIGTSFSQSRGQIVCNSSNTEHSHFQLQQ